jgi:Spy/CpxP family protein refolding chaperone
MRSRLAAGLLAVALATAGLVACQSGSACASPPLVLARGAGSHGGHSSGHGHSSSHGGSRSRPHAPHPVVVHPGGSGRHCDD